MGKVFFSVVTSLDGFIAPEGMDLAHADDPNFKDWLNQWTELQKVKITKAIHSPLVTHLRYAVTKP